MDNRFNLIITTCGNKEEAEKIIHALLSKQLAACIQVYEIKSFYSWKGEINTDNEQMLLIKAKTAFYEEIEVCIKENHSYEVPEIIQVPITNGSNTYLNWIDEVSKKDDHN